MTRKEILTANLEFGEPLLRIKVLRNALLMTASMAPTALKSRRRYRVTSKCIAHWMWYHTLRSVYSNPLQPFPRQVCTPEAMLSHYIACLSGFISAASTLNVAPQGSIAIVSDTSTSSSNLFELLSPSKQSTSWSNKSFTPAHPPSLPANSSALRAPGLDVDKPIFWEITPSGNVIGLQCNVRYGRRLDFRDCRDAYSYIQRTNERVSRIAQRGSGLPQDMGLPQRALGSTSSLLSRFFPIAHYYRGQRLLSLIVEAGKGKCRIDSEIIAPYDTARASPKNIAEASYALIERCAPRSGGIAINIGRCKWRSIPTE